MMKKLSAFLKSVFRFDRHHYIYQITVDPIVTTNDSATNVYSFTDSYSYNITY